MIELLIQIVVAKWRLPLHRKTLNKYRNFLVSIKWNYISYPCVIWLLEVSNSAKIRNTKKSSRRNIEFRMLRPKCYTTGGMVFRFKSFSAFYRTSRLSLFREIYFHVKINLQKPSCLVTIRRCYIEIFVTFLRTSVFKSILLFLWEYIP